MNAAITPTMNPVEHALLLLSELRESATTRERFIEACDEIVALVNGILRDCPTCHTPQEVDGQNYFITHRRGVEPGEVCTERPAIVETEQPTASYFVAEDAYRDVHLWSGREGGDDCQPLIAQRMLDAEHPALWPALLRGLGVKVAA